MLCYFYVFVCVCVCSVSWLFLLGCQYQCKWLTGKTSSPKWPICFDGNVKPYSLTHSLTRSPSCHPTNSVKSTEGNEHTVFVDKCLLIDWITAYGFDNVVHVICYRIWWPYRLVTKSQYWNMKYKSCHGTRWQTTFCGMSNENKQYSRWISSLNHSQFPYIWCVFVLHFMHNK